MGDLKYNYHDSNVETVAVGPRRELTLQVLLDPFINDEKVAIVKLSFRGINNIDAVIAFVERHLETRRGPAFLARIDDLTKTGRNDYQISFDDIGELTVNCKGHIEQHIHPRKVNEIGKSIHG
jgi:hypothetical protein